MTTRTSFLWKQSYLPQILRYFHLCFRIALYLHQVIRSYYHPTITLLFKCSFSTLKKILKSFIPEAVTFPSLQRTIFTSVPGRKLKKEVTESDITRRPIPGLRLPLAILFFPVNYCCERIDFSCLVSPLPTIIDNVGVYMSV